MSQLNKKKNKTVLTVLGIMFTALVVVGIGYFIYAFFQVENVEIVGNGRFTSSYVEELAAIESGTHMLLVDEESIKENVETEPYIEVVSVARRLPQTVEIEIRERQPKAIIVYSNHYLLSDSDAIILEALVTRPEDENYPLITGISVSEVILGQQLVTDDQFKLTVMHELLAEMEAKDLFKWIDSIDLTDVNNIYMTTIDGLAIQFGQADQIVDKMNWIQNRLPALVSEGTNTGVLDVSAGSFATYRPNADASVASAVDASAVDASAVDANAVDANAVDANAVDANAVG